MANENAQNTKLSLITTLYIKENGGIKGEEGGWPR